MFVSIVTCTWNSMATIVQTIASVDQQIGADYEQIFVDGGSTDGTLEYLESLPGRRRILRNVSGGIARAMNAGALEAKGEYLCHLHSDDYFLHSHVLSRVAQHFERSKADWLFGRILSDVDGALIPEQYRVPEYSFKRLVQGNFVPHPATFIRTRVFNEIGGFREDLRLAMDYEFFLRLASKYEPLALKEALAVFRRHEGSATQKNRLASFEEDHRVRMQYAGESLSERLMHAARYQVRKRRLLAQLAQLAQET
ncbi:glycosyltransferase family 2 protein [Roseateles oligotrophus]|uniref:Glycosyltransferase n=1 Tax=Roseateles oligotrophus TaxID=1769250 RepID=A0ABT2YJC3_9BURK|nr:glycosyltransferase family 2 protein [Roseateles oligotrophus]MCV2370154.1 glycosyltransferase [Roseateles oligotrophus]